MICCCWQTRFSEVVKHCGHRQITCSSPIFSLMTAQCRLHTFPSTATQTTFTADLSTFRIQRYRSWALAACLLASAITRFQGCKNRSRCLPLAGKFVPKYRPFDMFRGSNPTVLQQCFNNKSEILRWKANSIGLLFHAKFHFIGAGVLVS